MIFGNFFLAKLLLLNLDRPHLSLRGLRFGFVHLDGEEWLPLLLFFALVIFLLLLLGILQVPFVWLVVGPPIP